ncbi:MAG: site-specific DNA-methyltransferase [Bacteroidales bacterium]|nr:site-specific DNA-methyltransferase [Bacteroidales bacterium]
MIELDTIYNEDCLEGMKRIPDGSVDAIICDLPYGVLNKQSEGGGWDSIIPFEPLWEQYLRVAKPNAAIVLFAQGMFTAKLMMSNPAMWRYNLIWKKGDRASGFLNANKMPMRNHEDICVFYDKMPTYNPQMRKGLPNHTRGHGGGKMKNGCYGKFDPWGASKIITNEKFPLSIIDIDKGHDKESWIHPTQKPVDLLRYLVLTYSNSGGVILDNCMGSGTTAIACMKEHRHFIGFELDKTYYEKACARIDAEKQQLTLF